MDWVPDGQIGSPRNGLGPMDGLGPQGTDWVPKGRIGSPRDGLGPRGTDWVPEGWIGSEGNSLAHQQGTELSPPLLCSLVQRGEVPPVRGINRAVVLDQQCCHINMLQEEGRQMNWGSIPVLETQFTCSKFCM